MSNRKELFVLGAGLLGRLIIDVVESGNQYKIAGFFDDGYPVLKNVLGYNVIGKISDINNIISAKDLAIGIGEPRHRKNLYEKLSASGFRFPPLIHSTAFLSKHCKIDAAVLIGPNSSVLNGSHVKEGGCILSHVNINQDVLVESFCLISAGVVIANGAKLGEGCHIGLSNHVKLSQVIEPWKYFDLFD